MSFEKRIILAIHIVNEIALFCAIVATLNGVLQSTAFGVVMADLSAAVWCASSALWMLGNDLDDDDPRAV